MSKQQKKGLYVVLGLLAAFGIGGYIIKQRKANAVDKAKSDALAAASTGQTPSTASAQKPWIATPSITAAGAGAVTEIDWRLSQANI